MNENGPHSRCAICDGPDGAHNVYCSRSILKYAPDERRPTTAAERYKDLHLPNHEEEQHRAAYGRADATLDPFEPVLKQEQVLQTPYCGWCDDFHEIGSTGCKYLAYLEAKKTSTGVSPVDPPLLKDEYRTKPYRSDEVILAEHINRGVNPKDIVGATKTPLGLLPWTALVQVAKVFGVGAKKYGAYNWRTKGQPVQHVTYVEAAFRHLGAYMDGQTIDPETGLNHLAHAACGLMILLDASAIGNCVDNRPTPGLAAELMKL